MPKGVLHGHNHRCEIRLPGQSSCEKPVPPITPHGLPVNFQPVQEEVLSMGFSVRHSTHYINLFSQCTPSTLSPPTWPVQWGIDRAGISLLTVKTIIGLEWHRCFNISFSGDGVILGWAWHLNYYCCNVRRTHLIRHLHFNSDAASTTEKYPSPRWIWFPVSLAHPKVGYHLFLHLRNHSHKKLWKYS